MKRRFAMIPILVVAWMALSFQPATQAAAPQAPKTPPAPAAQAAESKATAPKAMELGDILAWKSLSMALLSTDGRWLAYRVSPLDGDSEVIVRQTQGDKEYRFPVGDIRGTPGMLAVSDDSKWVAFNVAPTKKEGAALKKQRKPLQNKVTILNLTDGSTTTVDKIQRFAFSGERSAWIALKKYGPDAPGGGAAPPSAAPAPGAAAPAGGAADDRPKGVDLILHELATGTELNLGNVNEFAFDKNGRFLALTIDATDKLGNGIVLHDMQTGVISPLDNGKASYERLSWTEKGDALAVLKGTDDKRYKDKVYAVVAFTKFGQPKPEKVVYDPAADKTFPEGMSWLYDISTAFYGDRSWWLGVFLVIIALAAWVFGEFVQRGRNHKTAAAIIALLLLIGGYAFALEKELNWREPVPETISTNPANNPSGKIDWQPWSAEAVAKARADGHPVIVDFTARWCATCRVNTLLAIEIPSVENKLREINAVALIADYTRRPDDITAELDRYNNAGVPLVLVFPKEPDAPAIVLPQILTPGIVLDALNQAAR